MKNLVRHRRGRQPGHVTDGPGPGLGTGKVAGAIGGQAVIGDVGGPGGERARASGLAPFPTAPGLQSQFPRQAIDPATRATVASNACIGRQPGRWR